MCSRFVKCGNQRDLPNQSTIPWLDYQTAMESREQENLNDVLSLSFSYRPRYYQTLNRGQCVQSSTNSRPSILLLHDIIIQVFKVSRD